MKIITTIKMMALMFKIQRINIIMKNNNNNNSPFILYQMIVLILRMLDLISLRDTETIKLSQ
jgi:hypothetical protein